MNKVILIGRLGQDPELSFMTDGSPLCKFTVATDESYKDSKTGERVPRVEWHKITVWGLFAETCQMNLQKGSQVMVEGKLETRSWNDTQGNKKYSTSVRAQKVEFLSKGQHSSKGKESNPAQASFCDESVEGFGTQFVPENVPF